MFKHHATFDRFTVVTCCDVNFWRFDTLCNSKLYMHCSCCANAK